MKKILILLSLTLIGCSSLEREPVNFKYGDKVTFQHEFFGTCVGFVMNYTHTYDDVYYKIKADCNSYQDLITVNQKELKVVNKK